MVLSHSTAASWVHWNSSYLNSLCSWKSLSNRVVEVVLSVDVDFLDDSS